MNDQQTRGFALGVPRDYLCDLQEIMADPEVNEVMINRHDVVYYERHGVVERIEGLAIVPATFDTAITVLANTNDKDQALLLDVHLPGLRIAAARFPMSIHGNMVSIRKHSVRRIVLDDHVHNDVFAVLPASRDHFIG